MVKQKEPVWVKILRILLGALFIFSGLMKAVDPIASAIKVDEYFISFGMGFMHPFTMFFGVCLSTAEMVLGWMMLHRTRIKLTTIFYLLFMMFFLLLTAWLAIAEHLEVHYGYNFGVVKDCGCFGQAVAMTNLQTFLKNVVIIIPTLIVFFKRKQIPDMRLTILGQWIFVFIGVILALVIQFLCYRHLPWIDFSDWKKGDNIAENFVDQPAQKSILYVYMNNEDSTLTYFTEDEMMIMYDRDTLFDTHFTYVDRKDSIISELVRCKIPGFTMTDFDGGEHSFELINTNKESLTYLVFMHDLDETNLEGIGILNELFEKAQANGIDMAAVTNSSDEKIAEFVKTNKVTFPIYHNTIDPIKGPFMTRDAIRSNPGLMVVEKGIVKEKWNWRDIPEMK
ncbi:MAG: hypothetical protein MJZ76_07005 [Bacteroidales bacterium]|nr:hypothetical protein [Bacteroidales bacterium]